VNNSPHYCIGYFLTILNPGLHQQDDENSNKNKVNFDIILIIFVTLFDLRQPLLNFSTSLLFLSISICSFSSSGSQGRPCALSPASSGEADQSVFLCELIDETRDETKEALSGYPLIAPPPTIGAAFHGQLSQLDSEASSELPQTIYHLRDRVQPVQLLGGQVQALESHF
jgi:hypothetical protein